MSPSSMADPGLILRRLSTPRGRRRGSAPAARGRPATLRLRLGASPEKLDADDGIRRLGEGNVGAQEGGRRGLVEPEVLIGRLDEELRDEGEGDLGVGDESVR